MFKWIWTQGLFSERYRTKGNSKSKFSKLNIFVIKRKKGDTEEKEEEHIDDNMKEMEDIQEENQEKKTVETEQTEDDHKDKEGGEPDGSKDSKGQEMVSSLICNLGGTYRDWCLENNNNLFNLCGTWTWDLWITYLWCPYL